MRSWSALVPPAALLPAGAPPAQADNIPVGDGGVGHAAAALVRRLRALTA
ncbi:hypothetical protein [Herbidospora yilanensis]|nr:hypothetical protein [Herbidospora yilanensis]